MSSDSLQLSVDSLGMEEKTHMSQSQAATNEDDKMAQTRARLEAWKQKQGVRPTAPANGDKTPTTDSKAAGHHSPLASDTHVTKKLKTDSRSVISKPGAKDPSQHNHGMYFLPSTIRFSLTPEKAKGRGLLGGKAISGFGLANKDTTMRATVVVEEEEQTRRKLEKLPTPDPDDLNVGVAEAEEEEGLGRLYADDDDNEEEVAAAAKAALDRRDARLAADRAQKDGTADAVMKDVQTPQLGGDDDEEMDPLDAFMMNLDKTTDDSSNKKAIVGKQTEPEAYYSDENEFGFAGEEEGKIDVKIKRKKDIPTVDHDKMDYEPFQKAFYTEPGEISDMTEDEVASLRFELDGIKVNGDPPKPVIKWSHMGLGIQSLNAINRIGFQTPTAIQAQAIPTIMSGRDVLGIAKTGSGKTLAFLLPMFRHIKAQRPLQNLEGPIGLILAPTRELATQIHRECKPWLKALDLRAVCAYGGAPVKDQINDLKSGAEIVVCTPGRMIDILAANNGRVTNLKRTTYVVLDEADRMFDMGFEPQVMKILKNIRPLSQIALFSATFPRNIEGLAKKILKDPVSIVVGGQGVVAKEIEQVVEVRTEEKKFHRLLYLLGKLYQNEDDKRTLIFVERQEAAEELMDLILKKGYPCNTIHGGKDQYDRNSVIADFKAGVIPVLVATSVAARGLDVPQLRMVVNYDAPNHLEDYVHRAGRTGRAGQSGLAVTFVTPEQDKLAPSIVKALKASNTEVPEELQALADGFTEKVKAGKERNNRHGFGGRGLSRFEAEREEARARERKAFKAAEDSDDEDEQDDARKDKVEQFMAKALGQNEEGEEKPTDTQSKQASDGGFVIPGIKVYKTERATQDAGSKPGGNGALDALAGINARLRKSNDVRGAAPIDNKGPDAGAFHATLEINDFPQKARWAVTNRTNVAKILESTGTSITTKGTFYEKGKEPGPTDLPKLYILVEGDTELAVKGAMQELHRLLREGVAAAVEGDARAAPTGRYSVV